MTAPGNGEAFTLFDAKILILKFFFRENYLKQLLGGSRVLYAEGGGELTGCFSHLTSVWTFLQEHHDVPLALHAGGLGEHKGV